MTAPTLHITNWSGKRLHGPGRRLTLMARPRAWERGEGSVPALVPPPDAVLDAKAGRLPFPDYRAMLQQRWATLDLTPGALLDSHNTPLADGDTLLCACSREVAAQGRCHRVWAAEALHAAGWRILLDGIPLGTPTLPLQTTLF